MVGMFYCFLIMGYSCSGLVVFKCGTLLNHALRLTIGQPVN
jgi:hypothetical protein